MAPISQSAMAEMALAVFCGIQIRALVERQLSYYLTVSERLFTGARLVLTHVFSPTAPLVALNAGLLLDDRVLSLGSNVGRWT